jgi:hypothetical protein
MKLFRLVGAYPEDGWIYCICYGNERASSSFSDVGGYSVIRRILDSVSNTLPVFVCRWEVQTYLRTQDFPSVMLPTQAMTYPGS